MVCFIKCHKDKITFSLFLICTIILSGCKKNISVVYESETVSESEQLSLMGWESGHYTSKDSLRTIYWDKNYTDEIFGKEIQGDIIALHNNKDVKCMQIKYNLDLPQGIYGINAKLSYTDEDGQYVTITSGSDIKENVFYTTSKERPFNCYYVSFGLPSERVIYFLLDENSIYSQKFLYKVEIKNIVYTDREYKGIYMSK